ncbi:RNA polymerase sigma factor [Luteolibacter pohnpeiensis]|uniref:RNA polymerase sigma factor n=1 Tax=Luteolibacter pohnpeiensis TaxID=454153 RepID=UPI001F36109F|nr:RNA polymerase sigma factor [Luteolibacter pohnpeiensis]
MRRTGNRQLAEEACQNVLCAVASKAEKLARKPDLLPAWLHRAIVYESAKAMRSESSQRRRKFLAEPPQTQEESAFVETFPHLDIAIDKLSESDRRVILLHYFQGLPFSQIAVVLGKSPAAVQKQSRRALEKLSRLLRAKGVSLGGGTIATGLTAEQAKAAPPALMKSVIGGALHGTSGYSSTGLNLMFAMKSKAMIPLALLLCFLPAGLQQIAISRTQTQLLGLKQAASNRGSDLLHVNRRFRSNIDRTTGIGLIPLLNEQDQARRTGGAVEKRFIAQLEKISSEEIIRLIKGSAVLKYNRTKIDVLLTNLINTLGARDPGLAVTTVTDAYSAKGANIFLIPDSIGPMVTLWAKEDGDICYQWYLNLSASVSIYQMNSTWILRKLSGPLILGLIHDHPDKAREIIEKTPANDSSGRYNLLSAARPQFGSEDDTLQTYLELLPLWRESLPSSSSAQIISKITSFIQSDSSLNLQKATHFLSEVNVTREEKLLLTESVAKRMLIHDSIPYDVINESKITNELIQWLDTELSVEDSKEVFRKAKFAQNEHRTNMALLALSDLAEMRNRSDDDIISTLSKHDFSGTMDRALEAASQIQNPDKRKSITQQLKSQRTNQ